MNHHFPYVGNTAAVICCNVVTGDSDQAAQYRSALYYVMHCTGPQAGVCPGRGPGRY